MRIAYMITRAETLGGAQVHVRDLAAALSRAGHEVLVFTGNVGVLTRQLEEVGVPHRQIEGLSRAIHPLRDLGAVRETAAALRTYRPDLVSTHSSKAGVVGRLAARRAGVPALFTAHGWAFTEGVGVASVGYRAVERLMAPLARRIITVSEFDRQLALRARIGEEGKVVTVHNGMPALVSGSSRADPGRNPPRLVMVARFHRQKDHATLLRALAGLVELDWTLDLIGDGVLLHETRRLAQTLGLEERVRFLGLRTDVESILAGAQLYLLISNWEGFPRSVLEGMRAGLPVIASDVGGVSEAVDSEVGELVPRGDEGALAGALRRLLTDPEARARMGSRALDRFQSSFTFERMMAQTVSVYEAVLRSAPEMEYP